MKTAFLLSFLLGSMAFAQGGPVTVCTPTIDEGAVNFYDANTGLNRISKIEVTMGAPGMGGQGIELNMTGTAGTGNKAAASTVKLAYASSYGSSLIEYNNALTTDQSPNNPFIQFEVEPATNGAKGLGALTVAFMAKGNIQLITSRYNCVSK